MCCVAGAWADDTRTIVKEISFPNFHPEQYLITGMKMGNDVRKVLVEQLQAEAGAAYYALESGVNPALYKYDGSTDSFKKVNDGDVLTWGQYYCETQVRIDGPNGKLYRFPDIPGDLKISINGKDPYRYSFDGYSGWNGYSDLYKGVYGGYINEEASVRWFQSFIFVVKDRKVVSPALFNGFNPAAYIEPGMKMGDEVRAILGAQFVPAEGASYYAQVSGSLPTLHRWNNSTSSFEQLYDGDEITIGTYRCGTQVRIDGVPGITQCFPAKAEDLEVRVNHEVCEVYGGYVDDKASVRWIYSPYFDVRSRKCGANLTWTYDGSEKRLVITGTGAMFTFTYDNSINTYRTPWYDIAGIEKVKLPTELTEIGRGAFYRKEELKEINIPNGVTAIGKGAFYSCSALASITIPNSVTSIGDEAFSMCDNLKSVVLPDAIETVGPSVFSNCYALASIELPASVKSLGEDAFMSCIGLKSITSLAVTPPTCGENAFQSVDKSIPVYVPKASLEAYKSADGWKEFTTFYVKGEPCGDHLVWVFDEETGTLSFVLTGSDKGTMTDFASTYEVPWYSVRSKVKTVELPEGLTNIGSNALAFCTALKSVTIPSSVTKIGRSAFRGSGLKSIAISNSVKTCQPYAFASCTNLTSVTIGSGIKTIEEKMFAECTALTEITLPDGITAVGVNAFEGCTGLTSVTLPFSLKTIGDNAFEGCTGLTSVTLPFSLKTIGDNAFNGCSALKTMNIPGSVTSIGVSAFTDCTSMTSVTIPASVTTITESAFSGCSALETLSLHSGITQIGAQAFKNCAGLTSIVPQAVTPPACEEDAFEGVDKTIPVYVPTMSISDYENAVVWKEFTKIQPETFVCGKNLSAVLIKGTLTVSGDGDMYDYEWDEEEKTSSAPWFAVRELINTVELPTGLTKVGAYAFAGCPKLTSMTLPDNVSAMGNGAFRSCTALESVTLSSELTAVSDSVFYGCKALNTIELNENIASIGDCSFLGCTGLTKIHLPNGLLSIGTFAFYECSSLAEIVIPDNVEYFGPFVFTWCSSLSSANIPAGMTVIADGLFCGCSALPYIEIPKGVTTIGESAFSGCSSFSELAIPAGVTTIGGSAFSGCSGLTEMALPSGVTEIAEFLFFGCRGLTSVTIPDGVTSIGEMAFGYCESLPDINIPEGVEQFGDRAFFGCSGLTSIEIPLGTKVIGERAYMDCSGLKNVTISNTVESIGKLAFNGCTSLTGVSIGSGVTTLDYWAFNGCSALTSITCKAEVPPVCEISVFDGVNKSIPVYVPKASVKAYQDAFDWNQFTHITAIRTCGDDLTWAYDEGTKTLTIFGTGDMYDFGWDEENKIPWYDLKDEILYIELSEHLTSIGDFAFFGCSKVENIRIPKHVKRIGNQAFGACAALTELAIPDAVTSIGDNAFASCESLKTVTLPKNITGIGTAWFVGCYALESFDFPETITSIGKNAFNSCTGLKSLELPAGITEIGDAAFYNCTALTRITAKSITPPACGVDVFDEVDKSVPVYVRLKAIKAYKAADGWKDFSTFKSLDGSMNILGHEITPDMYGKKLSMEGVGGDVYVTKTGIYLYNAVINASDATEPAIAVYGEEGADNFFVSGVNSRIVAGKDCPAAILADGKATVNINNSWTSLMDYKGNLTLDIYSESDGGAIVIPADADITLNLNNQASYSYDTLTIVSAYAGINTRYGGKCDIHASGNVRIFSSGYSCPIGYNDRTLTLNNTTMVLPYNGTVTEAGLFDATGGDAFALQLRTTLPVLQSGKAYPIELGGVTVSEGNAKNILGDGKASYNAETNTLTLNGMELDAEYAQALRVVNSSLNVEVKGDNSFSSGSPYPVIEAEAGNLFFFGANNARLTVTGENGVSGDQTETYGVAVRRCQVDVTTLGAHNLYALQADSLTVDAGTLHLTTKSDEADAVAWLSNNGSKNGGLVLKHAVIKKGLVNVDKEMLFNPMAEYTVTFLDKDGNLIETQTVFDGEDAVAPKAPEVEGYIFIGWSLPITDIHEDRTLKPDYEQKVCHVEFHDWDGKLIFQQDIYWGSAASKPVNPYREGYTFTGWDQDFSSVKEDMVVTAQYEIKTFTVRFLGWGDEGIYSQEVEWGGAATEPTEEEIPTHEGHTFTGWDKEFDNVTSDLEVRAVYAINTYTVRFYDHEDNVLSTQTVKWNEQAVEPLLPTWAGHSFTSWNVDFSHVKSNLDIRPIYDVITYKVTFVGFNGSVLKSENVAYGASATAPKAPQVEGYDFKGWDKDFANVQSDLTVTALYDIKKFDLNLSVNYGWITVEDVQKGTSNLMALSQTWQFDYNTEVRLTVKGNDNYEFTKWSDGNTDNPRTVFVTKDMELSTNCTLVHFTVTFLDKDGKEIKTESVEYGKSATAPEAPAVEGWHFTKWDTDCSNVKSDLTVKAVYEKNEYTVRFLDWDEKEISSQTVKYGEAATAPEQPVREGYDFAGWEPAGFNQVKSDMTIVAQYVIKTFTVQFIDFNFNEINRQTIEYGKDAAAPEAPQVEGYDFKGWDKDFTNVTENLLVKPVYAIKQFTVKFVDHDGTVLSEQTADWGKAAKAPADPVREGWTFTGWDPADFSQVKSDMVITARYSKDAVVYTVTFVDWNDEVIIAVKVLDGEDAVPPTDPVREGWTFSHWTGEYTGVHSDRTVKADYEINYYIVTFVDWDGYILLQQQVMYNTQANAPGNPEREGWIFKGWDKDFEHVTSNMTVTAQYEKDSATGLEDTQRDNTRGIKVIRNGVVYILRDGKIYTTTGARVR